MRVGSARARDENGSNLEGLQVLDLEMLLDESNWMEPGPQFPQLRGLGPLQMLVGSGGGVAYMPPKQADPSPATAGIQGTNSGSMRGGDCQRCRNPEA